MHYTKGKELFFLAILCILAIGLLGAKWFQPIMQGVRSILFPMEKALYSLGAEPPPTPDSALLDSALINSTRIAILESENKALREMLSFVSAKQYHSIGAEVVGRGTDPLRESLIINRGTREGIAAGQPVIAGRGFFIGKIVRAEPDMAVVQLLYDHQSKIAAATLSDSASMGLVEGGYGVSVRMNLIPQNEIIRVGDMVVTSGLEALIPHGLPIGTIEIVEKEAYQPFQRAVIAPSVDGRRQRLVSVIIL